MIILILIALFIKNHFREIAQGYWLALQLPEVSTAIIAVLLTLVIIGALGALVDAVVGYATGVDD